MGLAVRPPGVAAPRDRSQLSVLARRAWRAQAGVAAVFGLVSVLIGLVYWPGSLDADTFGELGEAATGHYTDWHTPILELLWRIPYLMGLHSPGWALLVGLYMLLLGFYLILRVRLSRLSACILAILCCVFPPVLTWAIHVGVDAWFAASMICAFGCVARITRTTGRARTWSTVGAVWFACIATAARHNAVPAVFVLFVALAAVTLPIRSPRRNLAVCGLGLVASMGVFLVELGVQSAAGTRSMHPAQATFLYDLAQLSKQEHRVLIPKDIDPGQSLAAIEDGITVYDPNGLLFGKGAAVHFPVPASAYSSLQSAWLSAIEHDPGGWLDERLRLGVWMLSIGHPSYWLYNPPLPQYPPPLFPSLNQRGYDYLSALAGSDHQHGDFLYDGWIYALILVVGAIVLWRHTKAERVISGLAIAMLLYTVVLEFSGPGELYRYIYPMVAAGTVVLVVLLSHGVSSIRVNMRSGRPVGTET